MCRNIRPLHGFEPPASGEEVSAAALQYVRKVSGYAKPPKANVAAFEAAVSRVAEATEALLAALEVTQPLKSREAEREKARQRWKKREARAAANGGSP